MQCLRATERKRSVYCVLIWRRWCCRLAELALQYKLLANIPLDLSLVSLTVNGTANVSSFSCSSVTSIGATQGVGTETAASFSSGGFSNIFAQPSFQSSAVSSYLTKLGNTNSGKFNTSGRAFPDIAFNGVDFNIVFDAEEGTVDGTSCSTPSFAAVVALINSQLIAAGKPTLGFLNPFIYSTASSAFTDITTGDNPGCGTNGFPATTGWDPVRCILTPLLKYHTLSTPPRSRVSALRSSLRFSPQPVSEHLPS